MASRSAWLSVSVKKGLRVVHRSRIIQCEWENSYFTMYFSIYTFDHLINFHFQTDLPTQIYNILARAT